MPKIKPYTAYPCIPAKAGIWIRLGEILIFIRMHGFGRISHALSQNDKTQTFNVMTNLVAVFQRQ